MQIQNPSYYKRESYATDQVTYYFEGMTFFNRWLDEVEANAKGVRRYVDNGRDVFEYINSPQNITRRASDRSWYGTTDPNLVMGNLDTFMFNNELDAFLSNLRNRTAQAQAIDLDQRKKLEFTAKEIGVFSFDLASLGLIPVFEYYSPLLKRVVSANNVRMKKTDNGKKVFYHISKPAIPTHLVEFDGGKNGYYSTILKRVVEKEELVLDANTNQFYYPDQEAIPEHDVEQVNKLNEKGKKQYTTTFKKSFIHLPKVESPLPRIDIIVGVGFVAGNINAVSQLPYNAMAAISLAEKLSKAGVNYKIVVAFANRVGNTRAFSFVNAKKDGEPLDKNRMATMMGDGRYIRKQGFRADIAMLYDGGYGRQITTGIGAPISDIAEYRNRYMQLLSNSTNPDDIRASKNPNTKIVFASATSETQAVQQFENAIDQIKNNIII